MKKWINYLSLLLHSKYHPKRELRHYYRKILDSPSFEDSVSIHSINKRITGELKKIRNAKNIPYKCNNKDEWLACYRSESNKNLEILSTGSSNITEWTKEIFKLTFPSESVLEIGCATGFSSLYLGLNGRKIGGLDFSQEMLNIFSAQAKQLGIQDVMTFCANVKNRLPIEDNSWDVVFHAGLVEHFTEDEVQFIINENRRIAKRLVVSMVPNANSVAYRLGKIYKEKNGQWFAGIENPKITQANYFITAGLKNIKEYSIDLESALWFLPETHCFSSVLRTIYRNLPTDDNCNQGYLLVTIGEK